MRLSCGRRKKLLTEDLLKFSVKYKKLKNGTVISKNLNDALDISSDDYYPSKKMKKGIFYTSRKQVLGWGLSMHGMKGYQRTFVSMPAIFVSEKSILSGIIPQMVSGGGCCNWSSGKPPICGCGNSLGEMYLDCYEFGEIRFNIKKVDRVYGKESNND